MEIALKMVTSANVNQVLGFLEKELVKTIEQDYENVRSNFSNDKLIVRILNTVNCLFMPYILVRFDIQKLPQKEVIC